MEEPKPLTTENIDAILRFIPVFEAPGFCFGAWESAQGLLPRHTLSAPAGELYDALYANHWIIKFEWMHWEEGQRIFFDSPTRLDHCALETLRKLLTAHVRQDRFCEGHLESIWQSGHLMAILYRLRDIRALQNRAERCSE